MQTIGGRVSKCEIKQTRNGKEFLAFSVAENVGFGESKKTTWYDCTSWDKSLPISQGTNVLVFGHVSEKVVGEKTYNQVEIYHVEILETASAKEKQAQVATAKPIIPTLTKKHLEEIPF